MTGKTGRGASGGGSEAGRVWRETFEASRKALRQNNRNKRQGLLTENEIDELARAAAWKAAEEVQG